MTAIINRKKYSTETADLIAYTGTLDQNGCTSCENLYKSPKGQFFIERESMHRNDRTGIELCTIEEAKDFYEEAPFHSEKWEVAFGEEIEEG